MKIRRIIEDISLNRFIREVIHYARKHPDAEFSKPSVGDDERAENSFMFRISMEFQEEKND
jgi:hypothetical protein